MVIYGNEFEQRKIISMTSDITVAQHWTPSCHLKVVEGGEMESESHGEEGGDEEVESGPAGNESDMDLDLLAESESDSEESQVRTTLCSATLHV